MSTCSSVHLFISRERVVVGHWLTEASVLLQLATPGHSDARTPEQWESDSHCL